jgi:hypothetical protein
VRLASGPPQADLLCRLINDFLRDHQPGVIVSTLTHNNCCARGEVLFAFSMAHPIFDIIRFLARKICCQLNIAIPEK